MENGALHDQLRDEMIVDVKKGISLKPERRLRYLRKLNF